jgi:uncharacterized protein (DUF433 family)
MRFTKTIASASVAAVLGLAGVSVAGATANAGSAQPATTTAAAVTGATGASGATGATGAKAGGAVKPAARKAARAVRRRRLRQAGKLAATTIGITPAELLKELRAGKTIATIATDHSVQPQAVITALEQAAAAKIAAAEGANKITAARAAKLTTRFNRVIPNLVNNWHLRQAAAG